MRTALIVNPVGPDPYKNLATISDLAHDAYGQGAGALLFGEMAITGMINNDDPGHDLPLAETVPGPFTAQMASIATGLSVWLAFGLLEREAGKLYDTVLILSPSGETRMKYRRINPRWHGRKADPAVYGSGEDLVKMESELGSMTCLICGDLWDERLRQKAGQLGVQWLYHPFGRDKPVEETSVESWWANEINEYSRLAREIGVPMLATSYLSQEVVAPEARTCGGAMVFNSDGRLIASLPPGRPGIVCYNFT